MKDENIKEILDYFRKYMSIDDCIRLSKIEDYITNLQKENEKLKREKIQKELCESLLDECDAHNKCLQQRIEKAIEYIKNCPEYLWANVNTKVLLNILGGDDNEK